MRPALALESAKRIKLDQLALRKAAVGSLRVKDQFSENDE